MLSLDYLQAFVLAVDLGSFSAAARHMGKAQSAVSAAIANLEIDAGVELFDRSGRSPVLTVEGQHLLPHARNVLSGSQEFLAKAMSMVEGEEGQLCLAVEEGIGAQPLFGVLAEFASHFHYVSLELLEPGPNDVAVLLQEGRADLGLMTEQDEYPQGFHYRGIGHTQLVPVCSKDHPLAKLVRVGYGDLGQHRQIIPQSRSLSAQRYLGERHSPTVWFAESPFVISELLLNGFGWAELPHTVVRSRLETGEFSRLQYDFQQSDMLKGLDVVWTECRALGPAGQWLLDRILTLPPSDWRE